MIWIFDLFRRVKKNGTNNIIPDTDFDKVKKRLELIKTLISLEESENILEQTSKLLLLTDNENIKKIAVLLLQKKYSNAIKAIDEFLDNYYQEKIKKEILIPYRKGNKWGFCNEDKKIVIDCIYDNVHRFSEGLASVTLNFRNGFINKSGNLVIPNIYNRTRNFSEGLAGVELDGENGYIDISGNLILTGNYTQYFDFKEGLARVKVNGKWGFIDKTGELAIPCLYDNAFDFNEGLAS